MYLASMAHVALLPAWLMYFQFPFLAFKPGFYHGGALLPIVAQAFVLNVYCMWVWLFQLTYCRSGSR